MASGIVDLDSLVRQRSPKPSPLVTAPTAPNRPYSIVATSTSSPLTMRLIGTAFGGMPFVPW